MLFFVKNTLKAIFFSVICVVIVQATHDHNENQPQQSITEFLHRKTISNEFTTLYQNNQLREELCDEKWSLDSDKALSKYLTTENIKTRLPLLYKLTDDLCKQILQTTNYSLKIKIGFDDNEEKIGYNALAKNILAHKGLNKYFALYPTTGIHTTPSHEQKYSMCIQLGYELITESSDITLIRSIAHEIGHIKHAHTLKRKYYSQLMDLLGLFLPLISGYHLCSENLSVYLWVPAVIALSIIFFCKYEKELCNYISRYHELEADKVSIEALLTNKEILHNNFDILQIINFIEQEEINCEKAYNYLQTNTTHPLTQTRFQVMRHFAKDKLGQNNQDLS